MFKSSDPFTSSMLARAMWKRVVMVLAGLVILWACIFWAIALA